MILIDTNILIAVIRAPDPGKLVGLLRQHDGAICGVVRAEILHGARSADERQKAVVMLGTLASIPISEATWDDVGDNLRALRSQGITVPFPDAVLATLAISNHLPLWTRDAHFTAMQQALPALILFREPA